MPVREALRSVHRSTGTCPAGTISPSAGGVKCGHKPRPGKTWPVFRRENDTPAAGRGGSRRPSQQWVLGGGWTGYDPGAAGPHPLSLGGGTSPRPPVTPALAPATPHLGAAPPDWLLAVTAARSAPAGSESAEPEPERPRRRSRAWSSHSHPRRWPEPPSPGPMPAELRQVGGKLAWGDPDTGVGGGGRGAGLPGRTSFCSAEPLARGSYCLAPLAGLRQARARARRVAV